MISKSFFSGFCFKNEEELFDEYIIKNNFTVAGFSYGAIQAFNEVINSNQRVDKLQLFSPAFFQTQDKKYVRLQLMFFNKDPKSYCENFLKNVAYPKELELEKYFELGTYEELEELLTFKWNEEDIQKILDKGTKIEVYLGSEDKIIDASLAKDFFRNYATVYYINNKGHIL